MKTVFFGPWVGEFGWEILWWHGWVKDLCRTVFRDHWKVVASFPGRYPLYPDADEFWPHPESFCRVPLSQRAYFADFWRNGYPLGNVWRKRFRYFVRPTLESVSLRPEGEYPEAENVASALLEHHRRRLPGDTTCFVPFLLSECPKYGGRIGLEVRGAARRDEDFVAHRPELGQQILERITPTDRGAKHLEALLGGNAPLICVFPRRRSVRRPDKNWPQEKYDRLVGLLGRHHPGYRIALLGDPKGAYYDGGVPEGCLDLINLDDDVRMDAQAAVLERAGLAIGSMSGGMLFALYCGCPGLVIGFQDERDAYFEANHLKTRLVYYPFMDGPVEEVIALAGGMLEGEIPPADQRSWDPLTYFGPLARIKGRVRLFVGQ